MVLLKKFTFNLYFFLIGYQSVIYFQCEKAESEIYSVVSEFSKREFQIIMKAEIDRMITRYTSQSGHWPTDPKYRKEFRQFVRKLPVFLKRHTSCLSEYIATINSQGRS